MLRNWLNRATSTSTPERRKTIQGAAAIFGIGIAALCMWQNAQTPFPIASNLNLVAEEDEITLPPGPNAELAAPSRGMKPIPAPPPLLSSPMLDQLVVHVDKHGNIDVAGELINPEVFRSLLTSVKEDSTGDVSVLIHANEKCEVSTIQKVVDVCEECLTSYRLRIEDSRSQSKPAKPADSSTRA
jgi:biopolymer transport protein ExbD